MTEAERTMAALLIQALNLEGKDVDSIDPAAPLFGSYETGWGLDSIDALEIALAVQQRHGVVLRSEDEAVRQAFSSLQTLTAFVLEHATVPVH